MCGRPPAGEVVHLGGTHVADDGDEGVQVGEVAVVQEEVLTVGVACVSCFVWKVGRLG